MSGRVEQWLHGSERTPDHTVDERVQELLEAIRRGAQRNDGESWDAANERHAEEFIAALCARFPGRAFEVRWPPAHDQPEKMLRQSLAYAGAPPGIPQEEPRRQPVGAGRTPAPASPGAAHDRLQLRLHGARRLPGAAGAGGALRHVARTRRRRQHHRGS